MSQLNKTDFNIDLNHSLVINMQHPDFKGVLNGREIINLSDYNKNNLNMSELSEKIDLLGINTLFISNTHGTKNGVIYGGDEENKEKIISLDKICDIILNPAFKKINNIVMDACFSGSSNLFVKLRKKLLSEGHKNPLDRNLTIIGPYCDGLTSDNKKYIELDDFTAVLNDPFFLKLLEIEEKICKLEKNKNFVKEAKKIITDLNDLKSKKDNVQIKKYIKKCIKFLKNIVKNEKINKKSIKKSKGCIWRIINVFGSCGINDKMRDEAFKTIKIEYKIDKKQIKNKFNSDLLLNDLISDEETDVDEATDVFMGFSDEESQNAYHFESLYDFFCNK